MNLFQIFFLIFVIVAIVVVFRRYREGFLGIKGTIFWIVFWVCAAIVVLIPNSTLVIAHRLGIGRGSDLIIYASVAIIFFLLFRFHIKMESLHRDMTKIVREIALKAKEKNEIRNPKSEV